MSTDKSQTFAYTIFCKTERPKVLAEHPDLNPHDIKKVLKARWLKLGDKQKLCLMTDHPGLHEIRAHWRRLQYNREMERQSLEADARDAAEARSYAEYEMHCEEDLERLKEENPDQCFHDNEDCYCFCDEVAESNMEAAWDRAARGGGGW